MFQIDATHWYDNSYCIKPSFIWDLKSSHITSERSNQMARAELRLTLSYCARKRPSSWERLRMDFQTPSDRISHCIHIDKTSCSQFFVPSGIFCRLVVVVYWPCDLKFVYPMINLFFLGIILKLNFLWNYACIVLTDLISKWVMRQNIFLFLSKTWWSRLNSCYSILFSNLK